MKTLISYKCEVCGSTFDTAEKALICETSKPLPPCPVAVGDTVKVAGKWDQQVCIVTGVTIGQDAYRVWVCCVELEHLRKLSAEGRCHTWLIHLDQEVEIARGTYTSVMSLTNIVEINGKTYLKAEGL